MKPKMKEWVVNVVLPHAEVASINREKWYFVQRWIRNPKMKSKILVVDDDRSDLKSTVKLLNFLGYTAVSAESGEEALRVIASEFDIDLVLTDLAMPGMNGRLSEQDRRCANRAPDHVRIVGPVNGNPFFIQAICLKQ